MREKIEKLAKTTLLLAFVVAFISAVFALATGSRIPIRFITLPSLFIALGSYITFIVAVFWDDIKPNGHP